MVLSSQRDQKIGLGAGVLASLHHCPNELTALREAYGVEPGGRQWGGGFQFEEECRD